MRFSRWFRLWTRYFYLLLLGRSRPKKRRRISERERIARRKRKNSRYSVNKERSRKIREGLRHRNTNYEAFARAMSICWAAFIVVTLFPIAVADWIDKSVKKQKSAKRRAKGMSNKSIGSSKNKARPVSRKSNVKDAQAFGKREQTAEKCMPNTAKIGKSKITTEATSKYAENHDNALYDETVTLTSTADASDGDIPTYMPLRKEDSHIAKRMTARGIDGAQVIDEGEYFDIELDGTLVLLKYSGGAFAVASDTDSVFLSVSLTLERRIYGVIVSRISADGEIDYEYEAWFDESR